ncbi:hypothetical protein AAY473_027868 [Plecturocebus cupreus]
MLCLAWHQEPLGWRQEVQAQARLGPRVSMSMSPQSMGGHCFGGGMHHLESQEWGSGLVCSGCQRTVTCTEEREARALLSVRRRSQRWMESCTSMLSCRVTVILSWWSDSRNLRGHGCGPELGPPPPTRDKELGRPHPPPPSPAHRRRQRQLSSAHATIQPQQVWLCCSLALLLCFPGCSGVISAHCNLCLLGSMETGLRHDGQAGLECLTSGDLPALASQSAGVAGMSHRARPREKTESQRGKVTWPRHREIKGPEEGRRPWTSCSLWSPVPPTLHVEMGFHHVGQAGLELLISSDPPTLASQSAGITGKWDPVARPVLNCSAWNRLRESEGPQVHRIRLEGFLLNREWLAHLNYETQKGKAQLHPSSCPIRANPGKLRNTTSPLPLCPGAQIHEDESSRLLKGGSPCASWRASRSSRCQRQTPARQAVLGAVTSHTLAIEVGQREVQGGTRATYPTCWLSALLVLSYTTAHVSGMDEWVGG